MDLIKESLPLIMTIVGIVISIVLSGVGSSKGASAVGKAAAALISEQPEKFGQALVLQMMSASQGLYGFIVGFLIFINIGDSMTFELGLRCLGAGALMGISGLLTAIPQAGIATAGIQILAKKPEHSTKGVLLSAMVETYAIFAFVVSVLIIL